MSRQPFDNLRFKIHNIPKSTDLLAEFPELRKHERLRVPVQQNEFIRYLIYLYDPKSDLIKEEPELRDRKKRASELSGFENYDSKVVLEIAFYFLTRVYNDRKFREWCVLQQELEEKQEARWTPIDEKETKDPKNLMEAHAKKRALGTQSLEIHKALDTIESEIFGDNDDLKQKANEMLLTTPEKIAAAYF